MKRWFPWAIAVLAIALVAGGALRAVKARKAQAAVAGAPVEAAAITLLPTTRINRRPMESCFRFERSPDVSD